MCAHKHGSDKCLFPEWIWTRVYSLSPESSTETLISNSNGVWSSLLNFVKRCTSARVLCHDVSYFEIKRAV